MKKNEVLKTWKNSLPQHRSRIDQVDATIAFLFDKTYVNGDNRVNGLITLLEILKKEFGDQLKDSNEAQSLFDKVP